jgi:hypothetical protein
VFQAELPKILEKPVFSLEDYEDSTLYAHMEPSGTFGNLRESSGIFGFFASFAGGMYSYVH